MNRDHRGITIATGFDIGQCDEKQIKNFGFPKSLEDKLLPFVGKTKADAKKILSSALKTVISPKEANRIDYKVKGFHH